jgi:phosphotransferase system enzyme I (PtsP)
VLTASRITCRVRHKPFLMSISDPGQESLVDEVVTRIRGGSWAPGALRTPSPSVRGFWAWMTVLRARAEDVQAIGRRIL